MNLIPRDFSSGGIVYPESDGQPMSESTLQLQWIVTLYTNLADLYRDNPDVFVAGNQLWYPVEGEPSICAAPDVYVVFGRPKGHRGSYQQWLEGNVPMTVVFEVLSPSNDFTEMEDKQDFYERYGVEEYYVFNPYKSRLTIYVRRGDVLLRTRPSHGFVSPRLGIRFDLSGSEMIVYRPDGGRFLTFEEVQAERKQAERRAGEAERRAGEAERRASDAERRAARLIELGRKARLGQASAEELQELERLERESLPPA